MRAWGRTRIVLDVRYRTIVALPIPLSFGFHTYNVTVGLSNTKQWLGWRSFPRAHEYGAHHVLRTAPLDRGSGPVMTRCHACHYNNTDLVRYLKVEDPHFLKLTSCSAFRSLQWFSSGRLNKNTRGRHLSHAKHWTCVSAQTCTRHDRATYTCI